jgi:para-nitrobenzyl esterase
VRPAGAAGGVRRPRRHHPRGYVLATREEFEGGDGTTLTPHDRSKYTIAFGSDSGVSVRIDCNRGRGLWRSTPPSGLEFGPLALTRAMCHPGSLHDQIARQWPLIRSCVVKDGYLFLSLMADGGIYEFEPLSR